MSDDKKTSIELGLVVNNLDKWSSKSLENLEEFLIKNTCLEPINEKFDDFNIKSWNLISSANRVYSLKSLNSLGTIFLKLLTKEFKKLSDYLLQNDYIFLKKFNWDDYLFKDNTQI